MASTYSTLKIELIGTGEQQGTWGTTTNTNLGTALEEAIVGRATANFTTDGDLTLTLTNSNATQVARNFVLNVTSGVSLTATRNLIVPTIEKPYIVQNNTTGSQSIVVKTTAGTGITVPNGKIGFLYTDATNVVSAFDYFNALTTPSATISGGTINNTTVGATTPASGAFTTVAGTTATFTGDGTFSGTGQVKLPAGTTAQRSGSPADGMLRYNTDLDSFEGYVDGIWGGIGGAQAGGAIITNKDEATVNYTIAAGENGLSVGPVTVASGVTITVSSGQRWLVL
jgi:hypothetical protein